MFRALTDYVELEIEFIDCEVFRKFLLSTLIVLTLWRSFPELRKSPTESINLRTHSFICTESGVEEELPEITI